MVKLTKRDSYWKITYEVGNDWGEDFYEETRTFTEEKDAMEFIESVESDYYDRIIGIEEVVEYVIG